MKVLCIDGCDLSTIEIEDFSIDGVIDHFNLSREDLKAAEEDNYMDSAEAVVEDFMPTNHVITVYDHDGAATYLVKNL